jgi:branched-chain amino acid aminotransferase
MSKYLCYNGDFVSSESRVISTENRAFCYGDGIFETIRCLNSEPLFFTNHFHRIKKSLELLKIEFPGEYSENFFRHKIHYLLQQNRIYKGARVRIHLFRSSGGLYTPINNKVDFIITSESINSELYTLPSKGLKIGVYTENRKPVQPLSALKSTNALLYVMAGIWRKKQNLDDCLIVNEEGKIIEGLSSNIFLVKDQVLFTTTADCGCVDGTMRRTILQIANEKQLIVKEVAGFSEKHILNADELLFTNAMGISYVSAYQNRRYYNSIARTIVKYLNEKVQKMISDKNRG